jgi:aldehyde dehydrogenase (NAD(P)+)
MLLVDPLIYPANQNAGNMGQVCTATSRLYVQDTVYDKFLELFKKQTKENTTIGSQFDSNTNHGPQISKAAQEKILGYIESGKSEGAEIVREEVFGPFVVIQSFKTEEEVVAKANDTEFGLGAAVFTRDIMRGHRVAGEIEAGMVWVGCSRFRKLRWAQLTVS